MSKHEELLRTLEEVERFKRRLQELIQLHESEDMYHCGKTLSAAKRSSMDLTRQLADFRRIQVYGGEER